MKRVKDSSFYCGKKMCLKSAWDTPEYLSDEDWNFAERVVAVLESGTPAQLYDLLWTDFNLGNRFFHHTLGWPEGAVYCQEPEYVTKSAFPGLRNHSIHRLKTAIQAHRDV